MKIDLTELEQMVEQRYVRRVVHPDGHLQLFNYTELCTYEGHWTDITRQCRGLILDMAGNIVARPYRKFFNHGEPNAPDLDLDAPTLVTDKADGSLGILYPNKPGAWAVATRGSFTSDQALHATEVWLDRYAPLWDPPEDATCLYEIVYPRNRIVVDYGDMDDMIFLGALDNETGETLNHQYGWPGPAIATYPYMTLREALKAPPRPGQEGLVVFFPDSGERLKLKQEDYVAIHRLVFGINARKIWERAGVHDLHRQGLTPKQIGMALMMDVGEVQGVLDAAPDGNWMDEMLKIVPEEFGTWTKATSKRIIESVDAWEAGMTLIFKQIKVTQLARKEAALKIQTQPKEAQGALFHLLDGKPIRTFAWRASRPEHETFKEEEGE